MNTDKIQQSLDILIGNIKTHTNNIKICYLHTYQ